MLTNIVYRGPEGLVLTGVGFHMSLWDGVYSAPPDPEACWDDDSNSDSDSDSEVANAFGFMYKASFNDRQGFLFHDACWSLFTALYHPNPIPRERLFEVCSSLPLTGSVLSWGHDYGGLLETQSGILYLEEIPNADDSIDLGFATHNPFHMPELHDTLNQETESPPAVADITSSKDSDVSQDYFVKLPQEILITIAQQLATTDFLSARLASQAFWPIFHDQLFWLSRFTVGGERFWLAKDYHQLEWRPDWRSLYRSTRDARLLPGVRNRQRIWNLITKIALILDLR